MTIPKLKRIKVGSETALRDWLRKQEEEPQEVMIVTCDKTSIDQYLATPQVRDALVAHGWQSGRSYTLNGGLVGHVATFGKG